MGIVSSLASVHKIPGDLAKSATKAVKSTGAALQTLSALAQNMGGEKTQKLERTEKFVQVGCYETLHRYSDLNLGRKLIAYKALEVGCYVTRHVETGCYLQVHQSNPHPIFHDLNEIKTAFAPIGSLLTYIGAPVLDFLRAH